MEEATEFQASQEPNQLEEEKLEITHFIKVDLNDAAKWGKFIAIFSFIMMGLMLLFPTIMAMRFSSSSVMDNGMQRFPFILLTAMYAFFIAIYFYPVYALLKFSTKIKYAVNYNDGIALEEAFRYLKNMFIYVGVLLLIGLFIYIIFALGIGLGSLIG